MEKARNNPKTCPEGMSRQAANYFLHLTEARLWAQLFPKDASEWALRTSRDEAANQDDRACAVYVLGVLAEHGGRPEMETLALIAASAPARWSALALEALVASDIGGHYRHVYVDKARQGCAAAIESLGLWPDQTSKVTLQSIVEEVATDTFASEGVYKAKRALKRLAMLEDPELPSVLSQQLRGRGADFVEWPTWAIRVASERGMKGIQPALRDRLDASRRLFDASISSYSRADNVDQLRQSDQYRRAFVQGFFIATVDLHFDDVLIANAKLGGDLTPIERDRLAALGYGSDPAVRLRELLGEERSD